MTDAVDAVEPDGGNESSDGDRPRPVAPWIALGIALVMVGLFVLLVGADTGGGEDAESPLLGRPAPETWPSAWRSFQRPGSSIPVVSCRCGSFLECPKND